jgi:hypothetical protein
MHYDRPLMNMNTSSTSHAEPFEHPALFYSGDAEFVAGTAEFARAGLAAGEPVLVALGPAGMGLLREELGDQADSVRWIDITGIGRNPARIIPLWREFTSTYPGAGGTWGIGQPIWPERNPAELVESQLHESLLNLAFADRSGFKLLCPYDLERLDPAVIDEAMRSHPHLRHDGAEEESPQYRGDEASTGPFMAPLPEPSGETAELALKTLSLSMVRGMIAERAFRIGLGLAQTDDLTLAVTAAANAVVRNGGGLALRVWSDQERLVCQVEGPAEIADPLAGREWPPAGHHLWLANQLCDLVQVRSMATGTVVRLHMVA